MSSDEVAKTLGNIFPISPFSVLRAIALADEYGMPVKFLRRVMSNYKLDIQYDGTTDYTRPFFDKMVLTGSTVNGLAGSGSGSIGTLYHESTHAYLEIVNAWNLSEFKDIFSYYEKAKLRNGETVDDVKRVITEAAAEYVDNRASAVWEVWRSIALAKNGLKTLREFKGKLAEGTYSIRERIADIPENYNKAMKEMVFGYQDFDGQQIKVVNQIPQQLQRYCDGVILEGKIMNHFEAMTVFSSPYRLLVQQSQQ